MDSTSSAGTAPGRSAFRARLTVPLIRALLIVGAGLLTLSPALKSGFFGDDDLYLLGNKLLLQPDRLWKAWFVPGSFIEYYPINQTVQWYQWKLWGLFSPLGYHVTNLVLHLTSALLIWWLFDKLKLKWAWLGGLIFAVHPMMVDSITAANELKNTLSLPPFLLAMGWYLNFERTGKPAHYFLALALFLVAMLCKITMAFFPLVILLYAWWKRGRIEWPDFKASFPFFVISLVLGILTIHAGEVYAEATNYISPGPIHLGGIGNRLALAGSCFVFYMGRSLFPLYPMSIYPQWSIDPLRPWHLIPWLCLAMTFICCWRRRHSWGRPALFGLGFFTLGMLPFLGLNQTSYMCMTWVGEHLLYLPMIGLIGLVLAALEKLPEKPAALLPALVTFAVVLLGCQAHAYAQRFTDLQDMWTYNLKCNPNSWMVRYHLGSVYFRKHEMPEALAQMQESVRLNPDFANSQYFLGLYLGVEKRYAESVRALGEAIRIAPTRPQPYYYRANALLNLGRYAEAIDQFNFFLQIYPNGTDARSRLSQALEKVGRLNDAVDQIEILLQSDPYNPDFQKRLAELQALQKQSTHPARLKP